MPRAAAATSCGEKEVLLYRGFEICITPKTRHTIPGGSRKGLGDYFYGWVGQPIARHTECRKKAVAVRTCRRMIDQWYDEEHQQRFFDIRDRWLYGRLPAETTGTQ